MERLPQKTRVAIVAGDKIGDSLISMVFARNFRESGYETVIFSSRLFELKSLFPGYQIEPTIPEERRWDMLESFDLYLFPANGEYLRHKDPTIEKMLLKKGADIFYQQKKLPLVFEELSSQVFGLSPTFSDPNMQRPKGLFRKYPKRIAIHPMSSRRDKNWQRKKFLKVAAKLEKRGFEPVFVLAPFEVSEWKNCGFKVVSFETLPKMATFLYESGLFFGNDSGLGHLASAMHLPTLTLCQRKKQGKRWGPAWGPSTMLYPAVHLPGLRIKELFWKYFISSARAYRVLDKLLERHSSQAQEVLDGCKSSQVDR